MDHAFWHDRWQRGDVGFHQAVVHDQLQRIWPRLAVQTGSSVFVPLAGKSLDMAWLAQQGHRVIGVELSEIAVREFFTEAVLTPTIVQTTSFSVFAAGLFTIYCGDIFDLAAQHLADVSAVYDRAALIALPEPLRQRYVSHLTHLLEPDSEVLLIAIDYPAGEMDGPPFAVPFKDVHRLYAPAFDIDVIETRDGLVHSDNLKKRGITRLEETAYRLRRRA
jgi:thiopurine S-methyltransferase